MGNSSNNYLCMGHFRNEGGRIENKAIYNLNIN